MKVAYPGGEFPSQPQASQTGWEPRTQPTKPHTGPPFSFPCVAQMVAFFLCLVTLFFMTEFPRALSGAFDSFLLAFEITGGTWGWGWGEVASQPCS